jgi:type II secretory ATPase GspE/PulE/Tfp pilus assembly ATPase PilB-like protein
MLSQQDKAIRVKQVYSELDRKFEEQETHNQAKKQNIAYINLYGFPVDTQALNLIPKQEAESLGVVVFYKEGRTLKLGIIEVSDTHKQIFSHLKEQGYQADVYMISQSSFHHMLEGYDKVITTKRKVEGINLTHAQSEVGSLKELSQKFENIPATQIIDQIVGAALNLSASDIHLEPEPNALKIRLRIDGILQDAASLDLDLHHQIVSRIKILSKLKLNVTSTPQDGSFSLTFDTNPVDIRVSVIPSTFGESIVMRILRQDRGSLKFEDLGITGLAAERILHEMEKPNGMILTTGPTGSGKTTTLYAILNKLNEVGVKIITLEDPVEYKIAGITQTPIDARAGMTFAEGLRAVLRQDPDIVMVGEMRDLETSEIACQAALTGHVVLSTLHTNDAPSAVPRLLDLGVKPFVLAPAINAIIGQRLVRKICQACKTEYDLPENLQSRAEMILKTIPKASQADIPKRIVFYHSVGCDKCNGLGYKGRIGVHEVFTISDEIEKLITKGATTTEIKAQAVAEGMITMAQDGILKALEGITDVEEVFRVTEG